MGRIRYMRFCGGPVGGMPDFCHILGDDQPPVCVDEVVIMNSNSRLRIKIKSVRPLPLRTTVAIEPQISPEVDDHGTEMCQLGFLVCWTWIGIIPRGSALASDHVTDASLLRCLLVFIIISPHQRRWRTLTRRRTVCMLGWPQCEHPWAMTLRAKYSRIKSNPMPSCFLTTISNISSPVQSKRKSLLLLLSSYVKAFILIVL